MSRLPLYVVWRPTGYVLVDRTRIEELLAEGWSATRPPTVTHPPTIPEILKTASGQLAVERLNMPEEPEPERRTRRADPLLLQLLRDDYIPGTLVDVDFGP